MNLDVTDALDGVYEQLQTVASDCGRRFRTGVPFPHVVIDGLFPDPLLSSVLDEFPGPDDPVWARSEVPDIQVKLRSNWKASGTSGPRPARSCISSIQGSSWLGFRRSPGSTT